MSATPPKGERRRDTRYEFGQPDIAVCVEHPGGGISRYLVWSRDLSAGGMAFVHGGFLHAGSKCRIVLNRRDGQGEVITGTVTACRLIEGWLHTVSVKFDARIDPARFVIVRADRSVHTGNVAPGSSAAAHAPSEAIEHINRTIADVHEVAKQLANAIEANDLVLARSACETLSGMKEAQNATSIVDAARQAHSMLSATNSLAEATSQLRLLCQLCESTRPGPPQRDR